MKVSFRKKYCDLIAFNFHYLFHSPIFYGALVIVIGIVTKRNWQAVINVAADRSLPLRLIVFVILELIPVVYIFIFVALGLLLANIGKMNKSVLTDCTITFGDDVIITESAYSRSEIQWAAVQKLARTRSYIFMYVSQTGALVIPKRAFDNEDACDQFWTACQARVKAQPRKSRT